MKNSTVDSDVLSDALVDVVDDIRREIHGALGTRTWEVAVVTRRWSGDAVGVGTPTDSILVLDPPPQISRSASDRLGAAGRESVGTLTLTRVSLRYSEEELQPKVDHRTEVAYRLTRLRLTQRQAPRWFVLIASPIARRGEDSGDNTDWMLKLNETSPLSPLDGVNAP